MQDADRRQRGQNLEDAGIGGGGPGVNDWVLVEQAGHKTAIVPHQQLIHPKVEREVGDLRRDPPPPS